MKAYRMIYYSVLVFSINSVLLTGSDRAQSRAFSRPASASNESGPAGATPLTRPTNVELKSQLSLKDSEYAFAYLDALNILSHRNSCSDFFGGSDASVEVFNQLAREITRTYIHKSIGIRMSGQYVTTTNYISGLRYRIFPRAEVNANGPFYRRKFFPADPWVPPIGSFPADTREARVLMLLHELGHLMGGAPGQWLLPDDGTSGVQSQENTHTVETHCGQSIRALSESTSLNRRH